MSGLIRKAVRTTLQWAGDERGQALIEYALIMCLIVVVVLIVLIVLIVLGNQVQNTYCNIMGKVVNPGGG